MAWTTWGGEGRVVNEPVFAARLPAVDRVTVAHTELISRSGRETGKLDAVGRDVLLVVDVQLVR